MASPKVGIDLVETKRFALKKSHSFLQKVFTPAELEYCFSFKDSAPHLAGLFAAKEAVSKALGVEKYPFAEIEITHAKSGAPKARRKGRLLPVAISITHAGKVAGAIAVG